jgi:curved DNA-binding protein CbpA
MHLQRSYYEVLGLSTGATTDEIKKRYRELARKFHPDLVQDKALGQRIFTQINQAYRVLGDTERRAQYDATLNSARALANSKQQAVIVSGTNASTAPKHPAAAQDKIDRMVHEADMAMMDLQAEKAKTLIEAVLRLDKENAQALAILGDALAQLKKTDEAIRTYRKALSISPSSIVQAKLSRLQSIRAMQVEAAAVVTNGNGNGSSNGHGKKTEAPSGGFIGRLLKRK